MVIMTRKKDETMHKVMTTKIIPTKVNAA